ncbi:MAG: hypothetical protein GXP49_06405 [Deltaproteobacteria bacterium]|nr:hypothetical protein [Deltaproteobacteria bacterium]
MMSGKQEKEKNPKQPGARLKRALKKALSVIAITLALLLCASLLLVLFFPWNWALQRAASRLEQERGISVTFENADVTGLSVLKITGLSVGPAHGRKNRLLKVKELDVQVDTWSLVKSGRLYVRHVNVESPVIQIVKRDHAWNIEEFVNRLLQPGGQKEATREEAPGLEKRQAGAAIDVENVRVSNLCVSVEQPEERLALEHVDLTGSLKSKGGESLVTANLKIGRQGRLEVRGTRAGGRGVSASISANISARMKNFDSLKADVIMRITPGPVPAAKIEMPKVLLLKAFSTARLGREQVEVRDFVLSAGFDNTNDADKVIIKADAGLAGGKHDRRFELDLDELNLDLSWIGRAVGPLLGLKGLEGTVRARTLHADIKLSDFGELMKGKIGSSRITGGFEFKGISLEQQRYGLKLKRVGGDARVSVGTPKGDTKGSILKGSWKIGAGRVSVRELSIPNARSAGSINVLPSGVSDLTFKASARSVETGLGKKTRRLDNPGIQGRVKINPRNNLLVFDHIRADLGGSVLARASGGIDLVSRRLTARTWIEHLKLDRLRQILSALKLGQALSLLRTDETHVSGTLSLDIGLRLNLNELSKPLTLAWLKKSKAVVDIKTGVNGFELRTGEIDIRHAGITAGIKGPLSCPKTTVSVFAARVKTREFTLLGLKGVATSLESSGRMNLEVDVSASKSNFIGGDILAAGAHAHVSTNLSFWPGKSEIENSKGNLELGVLKLVFKKQGVATGRVHMGVGYELHGPDMPGVNLALEVKSIDATGPLKLNMAFMKLDALFSGADNGSGLSMDSHASFSGVDSPWLDTGKIEQANLDLDGRVSKDLSHITVRRLSLSIPGKGLSALASGAAARNGSKLNLLNMSFSAGLDSVKRVKLFKDLSYKGKAGLSVNVTPLGRRELAVKGNFEAGDFDFFMDRYVRLTRLCGKVPVEQRIRINPGFEFEVKRGHVGHGPGRVLERLSDYETKHLRFDSLYLAGLEFGQSELDLNITDGALNVDSMQTSLLGGFAAGSLSMAFFPRRHDLLMDLYVQATGLNIGDVQGLKAGEKKQSSSRGSKISFAVSMALGLKDRMLDTKVQLTRIGPEMLDRALGLANRDGTNLGVEQVREKLESYNLKPKLVSARIKHGNLALTIKMEKAGTYGLGRIAAEQIEEISREQLRRVPVSLIFEEKLFKPLERLLFSSP